MTTLSTTNVSIISATVSRRVATATELTPDDIDSSETVLVTMQVFCLLISIIDDYDDSLNECTCMTNATTTTSVQCVTGQSTAIAILVRGHKPQGTRSL